jgi:transcriptional antiterminator NusG
MTKRWYIIHAYSNFEKKVAESVHERASLSGIEDLIEEIIVPTEEVIELRRGRKVTSEKRFFPGYVLIKMELTDEAFHLVKNTPKVTGFLGSDHGTKPHPVAQSEIDRITNRVQEGIDNPKPSIIFEIGEQVRVSEGPFASFSGFVEEVDEEKTRLKVAVSIFGRPTPVELQYGQVEKL